MPNRSTVLRRRWPLLTLLSLLAAALLAGCASLEVQQRKWIFMPASVTSGMQSWYGGRTDGMDDVWIEHVSAESGRGVKLHALWLAHEQPDAPVLLYLHGARRNVAGSAFRMRHMQALGFAVLAVDYRGFGQSTDELPSEATVYEDARAAWAWLEREHPERDRYIFGHSLGGAIAVHLAGEVADSKGLIVEGTFTSIPEVFQSFKWGWLPITPLITQRFEAADKIARVKTPVLVVHGSYDSLIRPELGRKLYEKAAGPKRFVLVEGGTHYSTSGVGRTQYREALKALFGLGA
ncbi:MAG: alpha/beta hydrolase [Methylibium sp. NZG]|nr:MAG: alpha/beta hydrolase [Methylibium sp. NZG]